MRQFQIILALFSFSILASALPTEGLTDLDGQTAALKHGKNKELVVFWATWCPDCKEKLAAELPKLNSSQDVAVVTINTDRSPKRAQSYVDKSGLKLPVFRDDHKHLRKSLKVFSVPHWAVYERANQSASWKLVDTAPAFEWERIQKALGKRT